MKYHSEIQEKIIEATISLIENSEGLIENITMRAIAQKADVAVGLINYHFTSKKNLIEVCVQRIISHVMRTFSGTEYVDDGESVGDKSGGDMASFTTSVFTFLVKHPEISKISMLSDLSQPSTESNSSVSYRAILKALHQTETGHADKVEAILDAEFQNIRETEGHHDTEFATTQAASESIDIESRNIRKVKAFMLLSTIQSAFLNREMSEMLLGFNLNDRDDYGHFFRLVTGILNIK